MADKGKMNKTSSISFTLPISCQVCLGKVKQPVVCPNYHAFCSTCIELWLQHNQQCPACRVPITPENPCKQVLGGPNFSEESSESSSQVASTPALRRTRLDLLYKEFEDEIERLSNEVDLVKSQKAELERQLYQAQQAGPSTSALSPSCKGMKLKGKEVKDDVDVMMVLTSKLKEATATYEKVKRDMDKMKEGNFRLRDENASLLRETGRLKQLITSRSPHKYERYAMSAQASRIDSCEKEIKMMRRALDRSDVYVEELEKTIAAYKVKYGEIKIESDSRSVPEQSEIARSEVVEVKVETDSGGTSGTGRRRRSSGKAVRVKQEVVEDDEEEEGGESSFQLEQPSPVTPATFLQRLTLDSNTKTGAVNSSSSTGSSTSTASSSDGLRSCTRQLDFSFQNEASSSHVNSQQLSICSIPDVIEDSQNTPTNLDSTLSNLDYSITPEFEACTKLLKAAEQRVHQRKQSSLEESPQDLTSQPGSSTQSNIADYRSSYILQDCDPTFQFNPHSTSTVLSSEFKYDPLRQRPPSAPAAPSLVDTNTGASSFQSMSFPNTVVTSTRPNSAPLDSVQSLQMLQCQPQIYSSNLNMSSQPIGSNLFPVQNPSRTSSYHTTLQSNSHGSMSSSQQSHISVPHLSHMSVPHQSHMSAPHQSHMAAPHQSQMTAPRITQQPSSSRSRELPVQSKTVYVLSGSRIAPLGDRRKRSSDVERRELRSSSVTCSPSKTQKL